MSARVKKHLETFKLLSKANPKLARSILLNAKPELVRALCECCHNILKGTVPLTNSQKTHLHKHKQRLRVLANRKTTQKKRRALLQTGGFLPQLLKPIIGLLGGLAGSLF